MDAARTHGVLGRAGAALVRRRSLILLPFFVAGPFLLRPVPAGAEPALEAAAFSLGVSAWTLRVWAMGYRNWVRGSGERHLLVRGPYAFLRHPRYVANFLLGLAWFLLVAQPALGAAYALVYGALLLPVVVREDEKIAQDYPGFAAWRARVPAFCPALWRWREVRARAPGEEFQLATVLRGLEPLKLVGFLAALTLLALGRRSL